MGKIVDVLKTGKILVSDGAWGTYLFAKGMGIGECPDAWSINRFDDVADIARSYSDAGADMVETNSFGANKFKLSHYGLEGKVSEINEAAARASRKGAPDRHVIASVGPTGKMLVMSKDVTKDDFYNVFKEQVMALERGGADAVCIETMNDIEEAVCAIKAAKENTGLEIISTFTFERNSKGKFWTMMGLSPANAAREALAAGADIVGTNCGNGMERMIEIVREMKESCPDAYILVHANAGLPENVDGRDIFPETPEMMAGYVPALIASGVNIVGGCCGTTPAHIAAIKKAVEEHNDIIAR
jgi:5-methyltetrahydrofolate--homocysteine methyltransferase